LGCARTACCQGRLKSRPVASRAGARQRRGYAPVLGRPDPIATPRPAAKRPHVLAQLQYGRRSHEDRAGSANTRRHECESRHRGRRPSRISPAARRAVPSARPGPCPSTPKSCYFMNAGHVEGGAPGRILSPANFGSRDLPVPAPRPALRGQEGARVDRNRDTRPSWASADRSCVASAIAGHAPVAVSKAPSVSASLVARCRARLRSRSGALCVGSAGPLHRDPLRWLGGKPESS
jgi:hypothetical protein